MMTNYPKNKILEDEIKQRDSENAFFNKLLDLEMNNKPRPKRPMKGGKKK